MAKKGTDILLPSLKAVPHLVISWVVQAHTSGPTALGDYATGKMRLMSPLLTGPPVLLPFAPWLSPEWEPRSQFWQWYNTGTCTSTSVSASASVCVCMCVCVRVCVYKLHSLVYCDSAFPSSHKNDHCEIKVIAFLKDCVPWRSLRCRNQACYQTVVWQTIATYKREGRGSETWSHKEDCS